MRTSGSATICAGRRPSVFSFLFDPTLDATNWRAAHALRPAVVTRKMSGDGKRTSHGAESQQILTSVLRTAISAASTSRTCWSRS